MSRVDLRSLLQHLRDAGDVVDVTRPVRTDGEMSAVVKALEPAGAPAVYFHDVVGSELPSVAGVFGTRARIAAALGKPVEVVLEEALRVIAEGGLEPQWVEQAQAPVHQVVSDEAPSLEELPVSTHSRGDAGKYLTSGVVLARDDVSGQINTGMYRMMVTGHNTVTINAAPDHDLGKVFSRAHAQGRSVDVAIVIGHHPAYAIASQLKNPPDIDTHRLVGGLTGEGLRVVQGRTIDLPIPADAEIVLEGTVDPTDRQSEGPFGEFSYYHGSAVAPVFTMTALTRREDAIFQDLHPTHAEHRCLWLYPGREARLLEAVRRSVPTVRDVRIPFMGGSFSAYISVNKRKESEATQAILAALAADHFLKHVYVVDDDIDIHDDQQVLWAVNVRFQAGRDLMVLPNQRGIRMDPSARPVIPGQASEFRTDKLGFDATIPHHPPFPERADLPLEQYADIELGQYLDREARERVERWDGIRAQVGE